MFSVLPQYGYYILISLISCYTYIKDLFTPTTSVQFIKTIDIKDYIFCSYIINQKGKVYKLYLLESVETNSLNLTELSKNNITHACICRVDSNGDITEYLYDITEKLNNFRYYFTNKGILWKHVLFNLEDISDDVVIYINKECKDKIKIVKDILETEFLIEL